MSSSKPVRVELSTEQEELVIVEVIDDRDVRLSIMDADGEERDCRVRMDALTSTLDYIRGRR